MHTPVFDSSSNAWLSAASELAAFADRNLVVTREMWAAFSPEQGHWISRTGSLNPAILSRHFAAASDKDLIGIVSEAPIPNYHMTVRSHWIGFRIPVDEGDAAADAFSVVTEVASWGLTPLLENRSVEGYQVWVLFDRSDSEKYHRVREARPMQYAAMRLSGSELHRFLAPWMALPGRVPGCSESSSFYNEGKWEGGSDAVRRLMISAVNDASLIAWQEHRAGILHDPPNAAPTKDEVIQRSSPDMIAGDSPPEYAAAALADDDYDDTDEESELPRDPAAVWRELPASRRAFLWFDTLFPPVLILLFAIVALGYLLSLFELSWLLPWILLGFGLWLVWRWRRAQR